MTAQTSALLRKEWIKLRRGVWILPLIVAYAAVDSFLTLKGIDRMHGPFGLWLTLVAKQPPFFADFILLGPCGVILGVLQAWPECQGKRLRLLFHLPESPERVVHVMVYTGLAVLTLLNLAAHGALAAAMLAFHLPRDIVLPVLASVLPYSLLSMALYMCTVAVLAVRGLPQKLIVLVCAYGAWSILSDAGTYGTVTLYGHWQYFVFALTFQFLVPFCVLQFIDAPTSKRFYKLSRAASLTLAVLALSAVLPTLFWRTFAPDPVRQSMIYSPVREEFVTSTSVTTRSIGLRGASNSYALEDGSPLTDREYFQSQPFLYTETLVKWGIFPESIGGFRIPPAKAKRNWEFESFSPRDWNSPDPMLHMLLEAEPEGARLEAPDDLFRVRADGRGLEFLNPEDGSVNHEKSEIFTRALAEAGFVFPIRALGGNPDPRKDYDVGYLLADAEGKLCQLQMVHGEPHCRLSADSLPDAVRGIIVREHRRREFMGFVATDSELCTVMLKDMRIRLLPMAGGFNPERTKIDFISNPVSRSVVTSDSGHWENGLKGMGLSPDFDFRRSFFLERNAEARKTLEQLGTIKSVLFPLALVQTRPGSAYRSLAFSRDGHFNAAMASRFFCLALYLWFVLRSRRTWRIWDPILVFMFGPTALAVIALAAWKPRLRLSLS